MPHMVRVYVRSVLIGVLLACCFVALLLALDVAHLRRLVLDSDIGWLAVILLVAFNTIIFGGVQFALAIMGQAEHPPSSGRRVWTFRTHQPGVAHVAAATSRKRR